MSCLDSTHFSDWKTYKILYISSYGLKDMNYIRYRYLHQFSENRETASNTSHREKLAPGNDIWDPGSWLGRWLDVDCRGWSWRRDPAVSYTKRIKKMENGSLRYLNTGTACCGTSNKPTGLPRVLINCERLRFWTSSRRLRAARYRLRRTDDEDFFWTEKQPVKGVAF
jgi:hypothetical protein